MISQAMSGTAPPMPDVLDPGGANLTRVRAYNERLVMSLVRRHGSLSKAAYHICRDHGSFCNSVGNREVGC